MFFSQNAGMTASNAQQLAQRVRDALTSAHGFQTWVSAQSDTELQGIGFAAGDVSLLRSCFADLDALYLLYNGQPAPPTYGITGTYNFGQSTRPVIGGATG
jgi:hypothetical protein